MTPKHILKYIFSRHAYGGGKWISFQCKKSALYIIYRYISEKRLEKRVALIGATVYTLLFEIARLGLSLYLEYAFTAYQHLYQGYTALIMLGLWVFYSGILFIIGAIIARAYREIYMADQPAIEKNPYTAIS